ncbi:MAG: polysaccharide deacetylase [Verrucomicrobiales bacterium]|nr:polysaccharide deacetylase [Verrucomicrobiales bacterium]
MSFGRFISGTPFTPEPRFQWPVGKRCAVMLCFDVDGETTVLSEEAALAGRLTTMSQCAYGPRVGVPRILGLLDHLEVPSTFFIPTWIVEQHPKMTGAIMDAGHEIGAHGHLHEKLATLSPEEEEAVLERSLKIFREEVGIRPTGYRAPWFEINPGTVDLLHHHGFEYNASLMGDDVPFQHENGLVEIPGNWMLEDWEQFAFNADPAWGFVPEDCDKVFRLWWDEFEAMRDYGCCFVLTLHPWLSGRPSRVKLLERLITGILESNDAWVATGSEIADWVSRHPNARNEIDFDHPGS